MAQAETMTFLDVFSRIAQRCHCPDEIREHKSSRSWEPRNTTRVGCVGTEPHSPRFSFRFAAEVAVRLYCVYEMKTSATIAPSAAANEIKLNVGCGTSGITGWCNIDSSPTILLSRIPLGRRLFRTPPWPRDVRRMNVLRGLPFADRIVAYIYSSHLLQGLTYEESLGLMKESFRVLRAGGVLRIVVPDLERIVKDYLADPGPFASHTLMKRLSLKTSAMRDLLGRGRGYEQMFDARSLIRLFVDAGFTNPEVCGFKKSRIPEIDDIELEQRKGESLYVEATK
jgi:predicted SAM-dependent methyltransferase